MPLEQANPQNFLIPQDVIGQQDTSQAISNGLVPNRLPNNLKEPTILSSKLARESTEDSIFKLNKILEQQRLASAKKSEIVAKNSLKSEIKPTTGGITSQDVQEYLGGDLSGLRLDELTGNFLIEDPNIQSILDKRIQINKNFNDINNRLEILKAGQDQTLAGVIDSIQQNLSQRVNLLKELI